MAECGKLYIVSTPIGNLEDITLRALRVLKEASVIAAEDTRHTKILLDHYEIKTAMVSYHAFNEHEKTDSLLDRIASGETVAVVSDAGTPAIADPGFLLVREAVKRGIEPIVVPGVSALTFSATAGALPVDRFRFANFAPVKSGRKRAFLEEIADSRETTFFYESPFRVAKTLTELAEITGPDRRVAVIREATKLHEEIFRGSAKEAAALFSARANIKGEFVIGVAPASDAPAPQEEER